MVFGELFVIWIVNNMLYEFEIMTEKPQLNLNSSFSEEYLLDAISCWVQ